MLVIIVGRCSRPGSVASLYLQRNELKRGGPAPLLGNQKRAGRKSFKILRSLLKGTKLRERCVTVLPLHKSINSNNGPKLITLE